MEEYTKRRSITKSIVLNTNQKQVWELISTPGHLNQVHPFCQSNKPINWDIDHHQDELIYLNGMHYIRSFLNWNPMDGYDLLIGENGGPQSYVVWSLEQDSESKCKLTITVHPYLLDNLPRFLSYIPFSFWVKPRLEKYLDSVLSGIDYVIQNGGDVPRNFKGKHSWFS